MSEVGHGLAVLREPSRFAAVLPWQIAGRLLRLASLGCFLYAFGLPTAPAVVIAATVPVIGQVAADPRGVPRPRPPP